MSLLVMAWQALPDAPGFMDRPIAWLDWTGIHMSPWKLVGWIGALMFGGRWLVQFIASKRAKKPVIPRVFWYMSIVGSLMTLAYFIFGKNDSVGILANLFPAFVAVYNLITHLRHHKNDPAGNAAV